MRCLGEGGWFSRRVWAWVGLRRGLQNGGAARAEILFPGCSKAFPGTPLAWQHSCLPSRIPGLPSITPQGNVRCPGMTAVHREQGPRSSASTGESAALQRMGGGSPWLHASTGQGTVEPELGSLGSGRGRGSSSGHYPVTESTAWPPVAPAHVGWDARTHGERLCLL